MALLKSSLSLLFSHFPLFLSSLYSVHSEHQETNQKNKNKMLLGKRQRPPISRTTSLSEIKFDLNLPSEPEPSDHQIQIPSSSRHSQLVTVDEHRQVHQRLLDHDGVHQRLLDQRLLAMVSPRGTQRRHSADYSEDFLRTCSLCKRHLVPGRDIYMYRGDRAFCSLECREQQITVDERKEKKKGSMRSTVAVAGGTANGERVSDAV